MDKVQKNALISSLNAKFDDVTTVVVAHYAGLTVSEISSLRNKMREAGGDINVIKNRLAKIACEGTSKASLAQFLSGPTLMAFSKDPVVAARIINDFSKENKKLLIVGGVFDSQSLDIDGVKNLATMPSLDELRGKIVGVLQAPAVKLASVTAAPARQIASVMRAYADKVA